MFACFLLCRFLIENSYGRVYVYRNHVYDKGEGGPKSIELKEIGPQFEVRLYQVLCTRFILF